jgi:hypothetical protein
VAGAEVAGAEVADGAGAAADTTADAADVTGAAADATGAGTAGAEVADGVGVAEGAKVAACACRENTSKMARIPAAAIATCTARRAMCRKIGCGMCSSHHRDRPDRLLVPLISGPKRADEPLFQAFSPRVTRNRTFVSVQNRNVRTVRPPPYSTDSGRTREAAESRLISANFGALETQ